MYTSPAERLVRSREARHTVDYLFAFWTALGWSLLSCGIYSYYVYYRLLERMGEHNRRRLAFLEAANELAWARAVEQGKGDELRPRFERVSADLWTMRRISEEFRDPALWLVIIVFSGGIGVIIAYWLLDADLVKHSAAEGDAERELVAILETLGVPVEWPYPTPPKPPHQYAWRIVATFASFGFYMLWWLADLMREGNDHFRWNWASEDAFVAALTSA